MTRRLPVAGVCLAAAAWLAASGPGRAAPPQAPDAALAADLDRLFDDPILSRATMGVRLEWLDEPGRPIYERNGARLVVPASNMKIVTMAAAAERLGWDFRWETRLEAQGTVADGTLDGDLIVTGTGDPTITTHDDGPAPVFLEWAEALHQAGIRRVRGRLVGDDNAFDDEGLGPGWAWDYLSAGYAAPSGALTYRENVATVRLIPGRAEGDPARAEIVPAGHLFDVDLGVRTGAAGSTASVQVDRTAGSARLVVRGTVPAGGAPVVRTTSIDNPTRAFVESLRLALAGRGIHVAGGAWDVDDLPAPPRADGRRLIARRESLPLSSVGGQFMKVSQNLYGETILKTIGRAAGRAGSVPAGRQAVRDTLAAWGIPADAIVMSDGSGLSRYNYVTADAIVAILRRVWDTERLRGPFLAALPIAGRDGTLQSRMRGTPLEGRVQAKTGTIANVRALSGFVHLPSGRKIVFSIIANHFTATSAQVDAIVEKALERVVTGASGTSGAPGTTGTVGTTGTSGAPGTTGTVGATGTQGAPAAGLER